VPLMGCTPKLGAVRESGQSRLMDQTVAGQNACNPQNHSRPFVIEWDATDASNLQSHANKDLVLVHYEGCSLTVLDECRLPDVRGGLGAYRPVEWTSGALERMDIANEGDLFAKLPLGAASLGTRVRGGERFHMEYYVAGTRNATRDAVYRAEIETIPGCEGATHFVAGYNLGAFALGSASGVEFSSGASVYGFGAGVKGSRGRSADKAGGQLASCQADSATEIEGCKAPVRLTLRAIRPGSNSQVIEVTAADSDAALNAAGKLRSEISGQNRAMALLREAGLKLNASDGPGCLAALDEHDRLAPKEASTEPSIPGARLRAECLAVAGKCEAGKTLFRRALESSLGTLGSPEMVEGQVRAMASTRCQGASMSVADQMRKAMSTLGKGAFAKLPLEECVLAYGVARRLQETITPKDQNDWQLADVTGQLRASAPKCFARAGDCEAAWKSYQELQTQYMAEHGIPAPKGNLAQERIEFESIVPQCKSAGGK
jgi:hypothetical protein